MGQSQPSADVLIIQPIGALMKTLKAPSPPKAAKGGFRSFFTAKVASRPTGRGGRSGGRGR